MADVDGDSVIVAVAVRDKLDKGEKLLVGDAVLCCVRDAVAQVLVVAVALQQLVADVHALEEEEIERVCRAEAEEEGDNIDEGEGMDVVENVDDELTV